MGGNFAPEEVKYCNMRVQEESKRIDSFASVIRTDLKKMESSSSKQVCRVSLFPVMYRIGFSDVTDNQPPPRSGPGDWSVWQLHDGKNK